MALMTTDYINGNQLATMLKYTFINKDQDRSMKLGMHFQVYKNYPDTHKSITKGQMSLSCSQLKQLYKDGHMQKREYTYALEVFKIYSKLMI